MKAVCKTVLWLAFAACGLTVGCVIHIGSDRSTTILPEGLPNVVEGTSYEQKLRTTDKGDYRWQIEDGELPPGLDLDEDSGVIFGRATQAGTFNFTVQADEEALFGRRGQRSYSLAVIARLKVRFTLDRARVGLEYTSSPASISGGVPPYSVTIWGLMAGLDFNYDTLVVHGKPATETSGQRVELHVRDSGSPQQEATAVATLVVRPEGVFIKTETPLPQAPIGQKYSQKLAATGGLEPYTWQVADGVLPGSSADPDRLRLNADTGLISGTPGQHAQTEVFTIKVTDSDSPPSTDSKQFKLVVPAIILTTALPEAPAGELYEQTLKAAGGTPPYTWSLSQGTLPVGLQLSAGGVISGTPASTATTSTFTVSMSDADSPATSAARQYTLVVPVGIETTLLPGASVDVPYSTELKAARGLPPYTWAVISGGLPAGLGLAASSGIISGTPTSSATTQTFTITVTDSASPADTAAREFTLAVTLVILTRTLPDGTVGVVYSQTLSAAGGVTPYTWSVTAGTPPLGLSLDTGTGLISGTPTAAGTYLFTVTLSDKNGTKTTQDLTIVVQ